MRKAARYAGATSPSRRQRIELVRDVLGADRAYLEELARTFRLHVYTFDSAAAGLFDPHDDETPEKAAARLLGSLPQLKAKGEVTRIGTAIRDLVRSFGARNEPVAGVLLLSDGRHTGGAPDPVEEARRADEGTAQGIPIYPVEIGDRDAARNVGVNRVDAPDVVLLAYGTNDLMRHTSPEQVVAATLGHVLRAREEGVDAFVALTPPAPQLGGDFGERVEALNALLRRAVHPDRILDFHSGFSAADFADTVHLDAGGQEKRARAAWAALRAAG